MGMDVTGYALNPSTLCLSLCVCRNHRKQPDAPQSARTTSGQEPSAHQFSTTSVLRWRGQRRGWGRGGERERSGAEPGGPGEVKAGGRR
ncbi:hypothetical protein AAFF_G00350780 [Aldrovandia affinis]|uniref:Uncharacterized protein n=1 Tax=Aldrovandia affinis TaxID=143900 RepID=A0AAD7R5P1_9TELE|nr:hypothetical protein AAFF_G00350780 [Aldrovandia affinis]